MRDFHISENLLYLTGHWRKMNSNPVCFGARDNKFGRFTISLSGRATKIRLVHISGSLACVGNVYHTHWGCRSSSFNFFETVITDATNNIIFPPSSIITESTQVGYDLDGYTLDSPEIQLSFKTTVSAGQEYRIWYGQDLNDVSENNNSGTACVDVFLAFR